MPDRTPRSSPGRDPAIVVESGDTAIITAVVSIPVLLRLHGLAEERRTTVPAVAGRVLEASLAPHGSGPDPGTAPAAPGAAAPAP